MSRRDPQTRRVQVSPELLKTPHLAPLPAAQSHHLVTVLRLGTGDSVLAFDGQGNERGGVLQASSQEAQPTSWSLLWQGEASQVLTNAPKLTLSCAVIKGERFEFTLEKATELGVGCIVPIVAARNVVRDGTGTQKRTRWEKIIAEAARQCERADVPELLETTTLQARLANIKADSSSTTRIVLWEGETERTLQTALAGAPANTPCELLIGPEGGFTPQEIADATAAGFVTASLGPRILRAETAAIVAVALTQALRPNIDNGSSNSDVAPTA